jgi:DNA processing protein
MSGVDKTEFTAIWNNAEKEIDVCANNGINLMSYSDVQYPERLKYIQDPPIILYTKGNISTLNREKSVAIIGTRDPSNYGIEYARRFSKLMASKGFSIISGLASGIDTIGHTACLDENGETAAVLAHGLATSIYPSENEKLAHRILDEDGCLVSEYGPMVGYKSYTFVERDRLQAGLSDGIVVIETDVNGGTMHTVKAAISQHRAVGALNHPSQFASVEKARGNRLLIEKGDAFPLFSLEDINQFETILGSDNWVLNSLFVNRNEIDKVEVKDTTQLELF